MNNYNEITITEDEYGIISIDENGEPKLIKPGLWYLDFQVILHLKGNHIRDPKLPTFLDFRLPEQVNPHLPQSYPQIWNLTTPTAETIQSICPVPKALFRDKEGNMIEIEYTKERDEHNRLPIYAIGENTKDSKNTDGRKSGGVHNELGNVPNSSSSFNALYPNISKNT